MSVPIHLECNWGLAINTPIYIYIYYDKCMITNLDTISYNTI